MKQLQLLFFLFVLIFTSCYQEDSLSIQDEETVEDQLQAFEDDPCLQLEDLPCDIDNPFILDALVGEFPDDNPTYGLLDHVMNCPHIALDSECETACPPVKITLGYNENDVPWVKSWSGNEELCNNEDIFPIADQQAIIDNAIAIALEYAPVCEETNVPMIPIHYDLFWDAIAPIGGTSYYIGVRVTYITPCLHSVFP